MRIGRVKPRRNRQVEQLPFEIKVVGGRRPGAGRKKIRVGEPNHVRRDVVTSRTPVHVTLKLQKDLPSLRTRSAFLRFAEAVRGAEKFGLRVVHFCIQSNHIHLIAESDSVGGLSKGMQSLTIRFAKSIQKFWRDDDEMQRGNKPRKRSGIFLGRYHAHVLKTPSEVKHALAYVLQNAARHWEKTTSKTMKILVQDPLSSLYQFSKPFELFGTKATTSAAKEFFSGDPPGLHKIAGEFLSKPKSWLLSMGWMRARTQ